jgi:transcriptional regulator with XRE-family HTH domain
MGEKSLDAFGPVLRRLRHEKNLTQDKLSEMVGVASPYISMLESGHNYPNLAMVFKLADALDVEAWEIVKAMNEADEKCFKEPKSR